MSRDPKCSEVFIGSISLVDSQKLISKFLQKKNIFPSLGIIYMHCVKVLFIVRIG